MTSSKETKQLAEYERARRQHLKDQETKVSEEGVRSTHKEYKGGIVDCLVQVPSCKVGQKVNGQMTYETWARLNGIYVSGNFIDAAHKRLVAKKREEEARNGERNLQQL